MQQYLKSLIILIIIFFLASSSNAQRSYSLVQDVPVQGSAANLAMPWAGGLNSVLLQTVDITGDGQEELISFDRSSQSFMVFNKKAASWQAHPELVCLLPPGISNWFLMKDYDADGRKDLFTFTSAGIRVFRNVAAPGNSAVWELAEEIVRYQSNERDVNLLVNSSDVPAIEDVDGDGDLDVLVYDPSGGGGLEYYRNMSVESSGQAGLYPFVKESRRWGGLSECECGIFAYNSEACRSGGAGERVMHAGGKSLLLLDVDGDGDLDLLNGFEECTELYYLENKGTSTDPYFDEYKTLLPGSNEGVGMGYPAAFLIETENSGRQDVVVSSQLGRSSSPLYDPAQSIWLYRQDAQNGTPGYTLLTKSFLQEEMIDAGEWAIPAFMDMEDDGDLDMILGSAGKAEEGGYASLRLYRNTGTAENPAFELAEEDFMGVNSLSLIQLQPQIIDFNKDGRQDLILIATETERYQRKVFLFLNTGTSGTVPFRLSERRELTTPIHIQLNPFFYDVNNDGAPDLLVGKSDGSLSLYENTGTTDLATFGPEIRSYLGFGLENFRRPLLPSVGDLTGNGQPDLLLSDGTGNIRYVENFLEDKENIVTAEFQFCEGEGEQSSWLGRKSWPVVVPLRSQQAPMLAVGSVAGGVWLLETDVPPIFPSAGKPELKVLPNPVEDTEEAFVLTNMPAKVRLISLTGQVLYEMEVGTGVKTELPVRGMQPSVYIVQALFQEGKCSSILLIVK